MATSIGDAYIDVHAKTDDFEKEASGKVGGAMKGVAAAAGAALVAAGGAQIFKSMITGASDLGETISKNNTVFGSASAEVIKFGQSAAQGLGQSTNQALAATGTFGNLLRALGLNEKAAADTSIEMVTLASDLASFNNTSVDEALEAIRSGLVGEAEPLKKFGVSMNEAALQAKALELGLITNIKEGLNPQQKALAASALIMSQTSLAHGDFAKTSGGLANQSKILKAELTNLSAEIGTKMLPVVVAVVSALVSKGIPALRDFGGIIQTQVVPRLKDFGSLIGSVIGPVFAKIGDILGDTIAIFKEFGFSIGTIGVVIQNALFEILSAFGVSDDTAMEWADRFLNAFQQIHLFITGTVVPLFKDKLLPALKDIAGVVKDVLLKAFEVWVQSWEIQIDIALKLADILINDVFPALKKIAEFIANNVEYFVALAAGITAVGVAIGIGMLPKLVAWLAATYAQVAGNIALAASTVAAYAPMIAVGLAVAALVAGIIYAYQHFEIFRDVVDAVGRFFRDTLLPIFQEVFAWLVDNVPPILATIGEVFVTAFGVAVEVVTIAIEVIRTVIETGIGFIQGIWRTFGDEMMLVITTVWDYIRNQIESVLTIIQGIINVVMGIIHGDFGRIWEGIQQIFDGALGYIRGLVDLALGLMQAAISAAMTVIAGIFDAAWDGIKKATSFLLDQIVAFFTALPGRILEALGNLLGLLVNVGADIAQGLWDGIKFVAEQILTYFVNLPGNFLLGMQRLLKLSLVLFDAGVEILDGMFDGIKKVFTSVSGWFIDLPNRLKGYLDGALTWLYSIGEYIIEGLWNGMKAVWNKVKGWFEEIVDAIPDFIKGPLGLKSPSVVMHDIGVNIMLGLEHGLIEGWSPIVDVMETGAIAIDGAFDGVDLTGVGEGIGNGLAAGLATGFDAAEQVIEDAITFTAEQLRRYAELGIPIIDPSNPLYPIYTGIDDPGIIPGAGDGFAFADGGMGRGWSLVGERGPELVDLGSGSQVYTNEQLMSLVGGNGTQTIVINNYIDAPSAAAANDVARRVAERTAQTLASVGMGVGLRQAAGR